MFDVAPTELLLVAVVALVVIGPKDLPRAMYYVGRWVAKARGTARHFRSGLSELVRKSELEEAEKKSAVEKNPGNPLPPDEPPSIARPAADS
jgi:sec-independent protein translocase protein TatB